MIILSQSYRHLLITFGQGSSLATGNWSYSNRNSQQSCRLAASQRKTMLTWQQTAQDLQCHCIHCHCAEINWCTMQVPCEKCLNKNLKTKALPNACTNFYTWSFVYSNIMQRIPPSPPIWNTAYTYKKNTGSWHKCPHSPMHLLAPWSRISTSK